MPGHDSGTPQKQKKRKQGYSGRSDTATGGRQNYRAPKPKAHPSPPARSDVVSGGGYATPHPDNMPHPALLGVGIKRPLKEFNSVVENVFNSFQDKFGYKPSPGLVYDVARSPLDVHQIPDLWGVPDSHMQADMQGRLHGVGIQPSKPIAGEDPFVTEIKSALKRQDNQWFSDHADDLNTFISTHGGYRQFNRAITNQLEAAQAHSQSFQESKRHMVGSAASSAIEDPRIGTGLPAQDTPAVTAHNKAIKQGGFDFLPLSVYVPKGVSQVLSNLTHAPQGLYQAGRAQALDTWDLARHGQWEPKRTIALGKAIFESTKNDFKHPADNPGNIALDILSGASVIGGTALRASKFGQVARAGSAEERAGVLGLAKDTVSRGKTLQRLGMKREVPLTKGRALVRALQKPRGGVFEMHLGDAVQQSQPLSENALWNAIQNFGYKKREGRAQAKWAQDVQDGAMTPIQDLLGRRVIDKYFSWPTKFGREMRREQALNDSLAQVKSGQLTQVVGKAFEISRMRMWLSKRSPRMLRGLTRGEHKAIQILATPLSSFDESATWWENLHKDLISQGYPKPAHELQLKDIRAARRVMANPRPKFLKALAITMEGANELEALKIRELGLVPETAKKRILFQGENLAPAIKEPAAQAGFGKSEGFYSPFQPRKYGKKGPKYTQTMPRRGAVGLVKPKLPAEVTHSLTGDSILAGDFRIDSSNMVAEQLARHYRVANSLDAYKKLWKSGRDEPKLNPDGTLARGQVAIRNVSNVPDDLRRMLNAYTEGTLDNAEVKLLGGQDLARLHESFHVPNAEAMGKMRGKVKWINEHTIPTEAEWIANIPHHPLTKLFDVANEPLRDIYLYARPAYALNFLGNAAMLLWSQGLATPANFARAFVSSSEKHGYGKKVTHWLDGQVYESKSRSFETPKGALPRLGKGSRFMGETWSRMTDTHWRRASIIHHYRRKGVKTRQDLESIMNNPEKNKGLVNEVSRRANKDMVEYNNLTPFERAALRHLIFVYPWVSRSSVWTIRSIVEHPVKAYVTNQLGKLAQAEDDKVFKHAPEWFKHTGYITTGWNDKGQPIIVNPTSVWTPSTLEQLKDSALGTTGIKRYAHFEDVLGPGAVFYIHAATGKDEFGNDYKGYPWLGSANPTVGRIAGAFGEAITSTPEFAPLEARTKKALPGINPTKTQGLSSYEAGTSTYSKREAAAAKNPSFQAPAWWKTWVAGGFAPRTADKHALQAKYWRDTKLAGDVSRDGGADLGKWMKWHKHSMSLVRKQISMQGQLLGKTPPKEIRDTVEWAGALDVNRRKWAQGRGHMPQNGHKMDMEIKVKTLAQQGYVSPVEATLLHKQVKNAKKDQMDILDRHLDSLAGAKKLLQWDRDAAAVWSFRPEVLKQTLAGSEGIVKPETAKALLSVKQKEKFAYARGYVGWKKQMAAAKQKGDLDHLIAAWEAEKRVGKLPSYERMDFLMQHQGVAARTQAVAKLALKSWTSLTPFEQELVSGKKQNGEKLFGYKEVAAQRAWAKHNYRSRQYSTDYLVKWVDSRAPGVGLKADYEFSQRPLAKRLTHYRIFKQLHPQTKLVIEAAGQWWDQNKGPYGITNTRQYWLNHVQTRAFQTEINKHHKAIEEMNMLGGSGGYESFIERLLNR